jgi:tetratricopeptide (TPR) repeat protein
MMNLKLGAIALSGTFLFAAFSLQAQTKKDAADVFNHAAELMTSNNFEAAIDSFETAITLCDKVGADANDVKEQAQKVLPSLYYSRLAKQFNDKNYTAAFVTARKTIDLGQKFDNQKVVEDSKNLTMQMYNIEGSNQAKAGNNQAAVAYFDSVLLINPDYYKATYSKSIAYFKMNDMAKFKENIDAAISKSKAASDVAFADQAQKTARDVFKGMGIKANQSKKFQSAVENLDEAVKYGGGEDKDIYYRLANSYNGLKKYDEAIEAAQKGVALETGDDTAKAKYYYELATAQLGKGNKTEACGSFKQAAFGPFAPASKAQMTNLKCK